MERAINTTCVLCFILRDLKYEFAARFTDELLLRDRNAKAIGDPNICTRAAMNAIIVEGNMHFLKYSLLGHVYLLILIIIEEVMKGLNIDFIMRLNLAFADKLTRPAIYKQLAFFPGEFSALKLAIAARTTLEKFQNDYKLGRLYNLTEWRISRRRAESNMHFAPQQNQYTTLIGENNFFQPFITLSMQENSKNLAYYLTAILRLNPVERYVDPNNVDDQDTKLLDFEILEYASQNDLPIFISIDGSVDQNGTATTSISVLAPDIRDTDELNRIE